jgi:hypothetical protein
MIGTTYTAPTPSDLDHAAAADTPQLLGPLARETDTLECIPRRLHQQYGRHPNGPFYLAWVRETQRASCDAYADAITAGELQVLRVGEVPTPESALALALERAG